MRLKTKLVLAATTATFAVVIALSVLFLGELLRQRVEQTAQQNEVMARQVLEMSRQAVVSGLTVMPPVDNSAEAMTAAVEVSLRSYQPLLDTMDGVVRYSPAVQDVSVQDALGRVLVSTDPLNSGRLLPARINFSRVRDEGRIRQLLEFFGPARVLDATLPLMRNGKPFLTVHIGVRSTFLKASYVPWLKGALLLAGLSGLISMLLAGMLAAVVLRPIEEISEQLEQLTGAEEIARLIAGDERGREQDAVVRVSATIDRLGRQIRSAEAGYSDLQANLNRVLDTLRDGVVLVTAERRAAMVSDAVAHFMSESKPAVGQVLEDIFRPETALGRAVLSVYERPLNVVETVRMEDGREVEFSLDRILDEEGQATLGTLVTLRDKGSARRLEQELEVSRRLAAVGRLTAGVGHEVKNPINAMVVHLELLRSKLEVAGKGREFLEPTMRHVEILAGEMARLDRVVETLADFTRPLELHLKQHDLAGVVGAVLELTGAEMAAREVSVRVALDHVAVRADGELLRQALLNLILNGMQAMPDGGTLRVMVRKVRHEAVVTIEDDGEGIAADVLPHIFELYFTTKARGSGIGLAMTYRIVQMHGGAMEVSSEQGRGSCFTLRLPASVLETRDDATRMQPAGAGRAG